MKSTTRVILRLTDYDVEPAIDLLVDTAKDWLNTEPEPGKPRINWVAKVGWNQAVNARFALHCVTECFGDITEDEKAVWLMELSNASAFRQYLEGKKIVPKATSVLDCD
jgi:hypothetical protein